MADGGIPQTPKSPKTGGLRGVKSVAKRALLRELKIYRRLRCLRLAV